MALFSSILSYLINKKQLNLSRLEVSLTMYFKIEGTAVKLILIGDLASVVSCIVLFGLDDLHLKRVHLQWNVSGHISALPCRQKEAITLQLFPQFLSIGLKTFLYLGIPVQCSRYGRGQCNALKPLETAGQPHWSVNTRNGNSSRCSGTEVCQRWTENDLLRTQRNELAEPLRQEVRVIPDCAFRRFPSAGGASQLCWPGPSISLWTIW